MCHRERKHLIQSSDEEKAKTMSLFYQEQKRTANLKRCLRSLQETVLLVLLLTHQSSSWRVLETNQSQEDDQLHIGKVTRASQLRQLGQTDWRILIPEAALSRRLRDHTAKDMSVVSSSSKQANQTSPRDPYSRRVPAATTKAFVEWDDDDNEQSLIEHELNRHLAFKPLKNNKLSIWTVQQPKVADPIRFEFKDSTQNSRNRALSNIHVKFDHQPNKLLPAVTASNNFRHQTGRSKLIYHGQWNSLEKQNDSKIRKTVDGIELQIDTHKPVNINRRSFNIQPTHTSPKLSAKTTGTTTLDPFSFRTAMASEEAEQEKDIYTTQVPSELISDHLRSNSNGSATIQSQESSGSSSDWRPIVVSTRTRRSGKTHKLPSASSLTGGNEQLSSQEPPSNKTTNLTSIATSKVLPRSSLLTLDYKWKPIARSDNAADRVIDLEQQKTSDAEKKSKDKSFGGSSIRSRNAQVELSRKIEQPFDREYDQEDESGSYEERNEDGTSFRHKKSSHPHKDIDTDDDEQDAKLSSKNLAGLSEEKWKPLETTTKSALGLSTGSSTTSGSITAKEVNTSTPKPKKSNANSNGTLYEQRSASDLNYIYSVSAPANQQQLQQQQTSAGAAYYSNYLVSSPQPAQVVQDQPSEIVDSTSGQMPEMIVDRTPEISAQQQQPHYDSYSMPQSVAAFQPVQPPPNRLPASYGNYANSYDTPSYYRAMRSLQQPQPQPPAARQQIQPTPSSQVMRQEHHYHYYTPSPSQHAQNIDRQQPLAAPIPSPAPAIVRELQPIMISQPIIQQQSSTTPAPTQIIREIIKEVPVQIVSQVQPAPIPTRFIMQAPFMMAPPPPSRQIPTTIIRDKLEPLGATVGGGHEAPAHRLIRQITAKMPEVAIRMPAPNINQFRLQVPPIQMTGTNNAFRTTSLNLTPVTRQTGSFIIPPMPKKTTTLMTETQEIPVHTTIVHSTQYTPATRTTVYTTDHQPVSTANRGAMSSYRAKR